MCLSSQLDPGPWYSEDYDRFSSENLSVYDFEDEKEFRELQNLAEIQQEDYYREKICGS